LCLRGHKDWVTSASFNSDGTRLVTASLDGGIKLWDVQKQREQQGLKRQSSSVWCVTFAPDNQTLFIGTHSGGQVISTPVAKLCVPIKSV
jgi:WD40 repeat protein